MNYAYPGLAASIQASSSRSAAGEQVLETVLASGILVVDDRKIIRELLRVYLTTGGYRNLIFAEDGDEALEMMTAHAPDLMIPDLRMPRMGGLDVCQAIRKDPDFRNLPVLVQTAADSPDDRSMTERQT